ncbi:MAG: 30S ribosomal protein S4 [Candidatus Yanofskybacteria bacterium]|nr:30S ribosomal protein S4 [Candidatus Yanofskybacteria bacterium]
MARYLGPKEKIERRLGERLGLKGERSNSPKSALVKRPYPPGQHGSGRRPRKLSEFGTQLRSKQKVRQMYRLLEKPFKAYVKKALENVKRESPYIGVVRSLETRLDNVVFRMGIAQSRDQARQIVGHGHITVNGKRAKTPSYVVRIGDVVGVREQSKASPYFTALLPRWFATYVVPEWLEVDKTKLTGSLKAIPTADQSGVQSGDLQALIEYYSR